MVRKEKTAKKLERHFKGIANHRRIEILKVIALNEGITLDEIANLLRCNFKTISGHTKTLVHSGLVVKKYKGKAVQHFLSPYGKIIYEFIEKFKNL